MRGQPELPRREKVEQPTLEAEQESIPVPASSSKELFEGAARQLEENRRRCREQRKGAEFLLSGLLVCQRCGSAYCGHRSWHRSSGTGCVYYRYYRCLGTDKYRYGGEAICGNGPLSGALLEQAVWLDVCALLQDPGRLRQEMERRLERRVPDDLGVAHHEGVIAHGKRRLARLIDAYENGLLEKQEFEPRIRRAKDQLARAEEALAEHAREAADDEQVRLLVGHFDAFAAQMRSGLDGADFATKRKILRLLVKRIEVDENEIRVVYKVQPDPFVQGPARGSFLQDCWRRPYNAFGVKAGGPPTLV